MKISEVSKILHSIGPKEVVDDYIADTEQAFGKDCWGELTKQELIEDFNDYKVNADPEERAIQREMVEQMKESSNTEHSMEYVIEELEECMAEIEDQLNRIEDLIQQHGNEMTYERARRYWLAHIKGALRKETEWLGGSMVTMEDTINELKGEEE